METLLGDASICYKGLSRLGPYINSVRDFISTSDETVPSVDWVNVNWGQLQSECFENNRGLYQPGTTLRPTKFEMPEFTGTPSPAKDSETKRKRVLWDRTEDGAAKSTSMSSKTRTAILFRGWIGYKYNGSILPYLRSMITELSLKSGGEYEVFLLVQVNDETSDIFSNPASYSALLESIPPELRDITLFWTEAFLEAWYPKVPDHDVEAQIYQAVQLFSKLRPDFEYFWQFELDSRLIGDTRSVLESLSKWAKAQPRKHLWERNAGFYIPKVHGSYENYSAFVEDGVDGLGVWGPATSSDISPIGPVPPAYNDQDAHQWGVGEEADLITLTPMVDIRGGDWVFSDHVGNFMDGLSTPRRTAPVAMTRCSKKLLHAIHDEQITTGKWVPSEATPPTFAVLFGLKSVYAPHPMYIDGDWTPEEMDKLFNAGPVSNLGGGNPSIYHYPYLNSELFKALTWWWPIPGAEHDHYPKKIWQRYMAGDCFPPMLLHPMKL